MTITPRMQSPAFAVANAMPALIALGKALHGARTGNVSVKLALLTHIRTSQINGCSYCVSYHSTEARKSGVSEDKLYALAAWRHSPYFTDAERAALELTEALTVIGAGEMVSDAIWAEAQRHFTDAEIAALILEVATTNLWNRINGSTRQVIAASAEAA